MFEDGRVIAEFHRGDLNSPSHTLVVYELKGSIFRICLTSTVSSSGSLQGHGKIVRECITSDGLKYVNCISDLVRSPDPVALFDSWRRPWNSESKRDCIRLDNVPGEMGTDTSGKLKLKEILWRGMWF